MKTAKYKYLIIDTMEHKVKNIIEDNSLTLKKKKPEADTVYKLDNTHA